ncbi:Anti-sigma regulatory factor (Ser/Thr protein kinase) [Dethiosulfatibacter aminovorans DSM 17477]|uniref:Anti-sigma regulatory factor (Ser/Thr protein kinase) n=1 Tax=Dethiosulfatibacter aminovorans DSM 17477 TaxID=1121476 RepID=A0A1M6KJZ3_9FIRM|nr:ATP-binding protein [Dethiosulfatibacter aminovorans]SHJ59288.1 Anti-sigma regulatory factor (Ser/Thr protein kinase) [Dethiosulfatibacter aminovorans DSM 17477]
MGNLIKKYEHEVVTDDFDLAGKASSAIKRVLKNLGISPQLVRRVAIISYEAEINIIIHSHGGKIILEIYDDRIRIKAQDRGPGIEDIELALSEGFSTADRKARELGFGAGMGLPNIRKNADGFKIESSSSGTKIEIDIIMD